MVMNCLHASPHIGTPTTPDRQQHSVVHHGETKLWGATHKMRVAEAVESLQNRRKTADQGDTGPTASSREDLMESSSSPSAPPYRVVSSRTASRYGIKPPNEEGEGV